MARSCGLRLGRNDFELLILEGNAKKPSVAACVVGTIPADSEDPVGDLCDALKQATKGLKVPTDAIGLVVDTGLAAFRSLTLPFDDRAKVKQVLKFEVESLIPQWEIDDVVVDFHVTKSTGVESSLLTTVVPKAPLAELIEVATRAGLEPLDAEVETSAVTNAAAVAGLLTDDASQVLVHVGAASTAITVTENGAVSSMRSARIGTDQAGASERLLREIRRTVAGMQTEHPLDGIYLAGVELPGVIGEVVEGASIAALDAFEADMLPEGRTAASLAAVYGAALGRMGAGPVRASLRLEELRFAGKLERLELPLAVFALLLVAVMGIQYVVLQKERAPLEQDMETWYASSNIYMLGEPKKGTAGYISTADPILQKKVNAWTLNIEAGLLSEYDGLRRIQEHLKSEVRTLRKKLGKDTEIRKPQSAFGALTRVLEVLDGLGQERHGYFAIRAASSEFRPGRSGGKDYVEVKLSMTFFGEGDSPEALVHWDNFRAEVMAKTWCTGFPDVGVRTLDGGGGVYVDGVKINIDMSKFEEGASS